MLIFVGMLVQRVCCSLENDMLTQTNKYRVEHNMEELYNLPSLQKAADLQVLHMCKKGKLTHDGPDGKTLAGRLKEFDFVGLNIGENIAKQGNDDYKEVVKLWMKSAEHRNNILGDYVYSGVSTCKGRDSNRYWVQVFGKDISNTKIAKIRDGIDPQNDNCDGDVNGSTTREDKDAARPEDMQSKNDPSQGVGYVMLVGPPDGQDGPGYSDPFRSSGTDKEIPDDRYIKELLGSVGGMNYNIRQRGMLNFPSGGNPYLNWRFIRRNKPIAGKSYVQRIRDMDNDEAMWKENERSGFLSFGDYLLSSASQDDKNKSPGTSVQKTTPNIIMRDPSSKVVTSTTSVLTFILKNPNNSSVLPAIQSLVAILKGSGEDQESGSPAGSMTMLSTISPISSTSVADASAFPTQDATSNTYTSSRLSGQASSSRNEYATSSKVPLGSPTIVTKTMTATVYGDSSSTSNVFESSQISSRSQIDSNTTSSETVKSVMTTTIYLPGNQSVPRSPYETGSSSARTLESLKQDELRLVMRLLGSNAIDSINRTVGKPRTGVDASEKNERRDVNSDIQGLRDMLGRYTKPHDGVSEDKCQYGYNGDGACAQLKPEDEQRLKNMLEELIRGGRLHLHILPTDTNNECFGDAACSQKGNEVDIGIPFSYKPQFG